MWWRFSVQEAIESRPLTVVGAGPAGILAASTAAAAGVRVIVVDENPSPGGQYYRQSPTEFDIPDRAAAHSGHPEAATLYDRLDHPNIHVLQGVRVWGVFDGNTLALTDEEQTLLLDTDRLVLATGAHDRPIAFPGWTLPGVFGVGAVLRLIKSQWIIPGQRFMLAGLGPLQLVLADLLLKSGAEVVCVAEAANPSRGWRHLPGLWGHWDRLRDAWEYRRTLWRNKVPLLFNHAIKSASGDERVTAAEIVRIDQDGAPVPGTERTFDVDTVCLGYGLLPSYQLPAAIGCGLRFDENLQWFVPRHDENMETSVPGIFVAGDVTDMGGAHVAAAEGRIAGLVAAYQLGCLDETGFRQRMTRARPELHSLNRLAGSLQRIYKFRPGLARLMRDDTVLCRCEEVRTQALKEVISAGAIDLHQVKLRTRAGMGNCQGRTCSSLIAPQIAAQTGVALGDLSPFTTRPPLQPIRLGALCR
jgi:thioredoxin reductase